MSFPYELLEADGIFALPWAAASQGAIHQHQKQQCLGFDITSTCDELQRRRGNLPLRVSSMLMHGIVLVYDEKMKHRIKAIDQSVLTTFPTVSQKTKARVTARTPNQFLEPTEEQFEIQSRDWFEQHDPKGENPTREYKEGVATVIPAEASSLEAPATQLEPNKELMEMYTADGPLTVDGSKMTFGSGEHEEEDNVLAQSGSTASEEALDLASLPPPPSPRRRRRRRYHSIDSTQLTIPRATYVLWISDTSDIVTDCPLVKPKGVAVTAHGPANVTAGFEADPSEKTAQQYSLDVLESRQSDLAATATIPEEAGEEVKEMSPLPPIPEEDEDEENVNVEFGKFDRIPAISGAPEIEMLQEIAPDDSSFHLREDIERALRGRQSVAFHDIFPPGIATRAQAASAFAHLLEAQSKGLVSLKQDEWMGKIVISKADAAEV